MSMMDELTTSTVDIPAQAAETSYRVLDHLNKEIRLLVIEPGPRTEAIHCSLGHAILVRQPPPLYETISYVWGDPSQRDTLYLDNQLIDVPHSTVDVLRRMRYEDKKRVVWIDAVCINQRDIEERNSQVAIMGEIYEMASVNLIWLGEDDDAAIAKADASMTTILTDMRNRTNDCRDLTKQIYASQGQMLYSTSSISVDFDLDSIIRYFASPWFTRVWTAQEAALPAKSICHRGNSTRPLEDVLRVAMWLGHHMKILMSLRGIQSTGFREAFNMFMYADHEYGRHEVLYNQNDRAATTGLLIGATHRREAFDPRDHVYAMLGLYRKYMRTSVLPTALTPDYRAPVSNVFRDTVRLIIAEDKSLEALEGAFRRPESLCIEGWPSWVPQWHLDGDGYSDNHMVNISGIRAAADTRLDLSILSSTDDANILTVQGIKLGAVSEMTPEFEKRRFQNEGAKVMRDLLTRADEIDRRSRPESHGASNRLPHTLIIGLDGHVQLVAEDRSSELYAAFRHYIFDLDKFPGGLDTVSENESATARDAADYSQALASACWNRCIFSTTSGYLGRGPSLARSGDIVAILFGARCPFVLRPLDLQQDRYEIIGFCWVYGVMGGELVQGLENPYGNSTIFHIC